MIAFRQLRNMALTANARKPPNVLSPGGFYCSFDGVPRAWFHAGILSLFKLRQPRPVFLDQIVAEFADIVDREFGGGVRVEHSGVVDMLFFTGKGRF